MDDAVVGVHHPPIGKSELASIGRKRVHLFARHGVGNGFILVVRRRVVVGHAEDVVGPKTLQTTGT